ncbi:MAG: hypothetical protein Q4B03_01445 [Lachnospiraceae bacterium]|nr:hypothetical protein [Lachnospiraceae bacterium]
MRPEDMKNHIPETPDYIHQMIVQEVEKQVQNPTVEDIPVRRNLRWSGMKAAGILLAGLLGMSTLTYAGVQVYKVLIEKKGAYGAALDVQGDAAVELPAQVPVINIDAEYIPEGMEWTDSTHISYSDSNHTGGFAFAKVLLDREDYEQVLLEKNAVDTEERIFGDYAGVYLRYNELVGNGAYTQRIYLFCPEFYQAVVIFAGADVEKEEVFQVTEHLQLTAGEAMLDTKYGLTWSELFGQTVDEHYTDYLAEDKLKVHPIGNSFPVIGFGMNSDGTFSEEQLEVCVDSVQIADDLQLLDPDLVPEVWRAAVSEDGKLVPNTLYYIQFGDGVDTTNELVKTESVPQKLVYATVTYTNTSEKDLSHIVYNGNLVLLYQKDGRYQIFNPREQFGDGYERIDWKGAAHTAWYSTVTDDYGDGGNYIPELKAGESVQIHMAWIVNETEAEHLYLSLTDGEGFEFTDAMINDGLVDISWKS